MRTLRAFFSRIGGSFAPARRDRELADELASHLQMHIDDNVRAGMTADEARRDALIKLGGVDQVKEQYRDRRGLPWLAMVSQDVRFALRLMRRTPAFTIVAIVTLALGIGANTVMFSIVNTVLLRPLPYRDAGRLVNVDTLGPSGAPWATSPPDYYEYRSKNRTLEHLDAYYTRSLNLTGNAEPERVRGLAVSPEFFTTLGSTMALGRAFTMDEERWGSHEVVILTDGLWKRRFAADPNIVGRQITINLRPYTIIGVLPADFSFLGMEASVFVPMSFEAGDNLNSHNNYFLTMVGRLKPASTQADANADLNRISDAIIAVSPENKGTSITMSPLKDVLVKDTRRPVVVLLGAVGFVLLIACANLANLLLARGAARQREIVIRRAIGATRGRLLRQFLTESVLLAAIGGAAGLAVAYFASNTLNLLSQNVLPRAEPIRIDAAVLLFTLAAAMMTGVLFGLLPALHTSAVDVNEGLKDGTRGASEGAGRHRLRAALVVAEVALSVVLLAGAGLMVKSMYRLLNVDAGFQSDRVLTMLINLPRQKYVDAQLERRFSPVAYARATRFYSDLIERIRPLPGVTAAGAINGLPLMGEIWSKNITHYDRPFPSDFRTLPTIQYRTVAGDYFRALGIRLIHGRAFTDADTQPAAKVAIVNQALVRRDYDGQNPIGKIISVNPPLEILPESVLAEARRGGLPADYEPDKYTIIGVADDVRYGQLNKAAVPVVYTPYAQGSEGATDMYLTIRTEGEPTAVVGAIRDQVRQLDADLPIASIRTLDDRVSASIAAPRLQVTVLGVFAALALLLAAIGIYGVMSYGVTQRRREIGIRMALGAARGDVLGLILRQGFTVTAIGLAIGLGAALLLTRVIRTLLFEVSATDPAVFVAILAVLAATGSIAAYLPARRATKVNPIDTLRYE